MLVLNRKPGERIMIGSNIVVTVLHVQGDRVRLGFDAPGETPIYREEIFNRMQMQSPPLERGNGFDSPYFVECA